MFNRSAARDFRLRPLFTVASLKKQTGSFAVYIHHNVMNINMENSVLLFKNTGVKQQQTYITFVLRQGSAGQLYTTATDRSHASDAVRLHSSRRQLLKHAGLAGLPWSWEETAAGRHETSAASPEHTDPNMWPFATERPQRLGPSQRPATGSGNLVRIKTLIWNV